MSKATPLRKAARDQCCAVGIFPACIGWIDTETTVLAHLRSMEGGMGLKAGPDWWAAYACSVCHDIIDGRQPRPEGVTAIEVLRCEMRGLEKTLASLIDRDLIQVKGINL